MNNDNIGIAFIVFLWLFAEGLGEIIIRWIW